MNYQNFKFSQKALALALTGILAGCGGGDSDGDSSSSSGSGSNDRPSTPTITIDNMSFREGDSGETLVRLRMNLTGSSDREIRVNYETLATGNAEGGVDFEMDQGTVVFEPGSRRQELLLTAVGDSSFEDDEWFEVELSDPTNAVLGNRGRIARITIENDDDKPQVYFISPEQTVAETVRSANLTLALDNVSGFDTIISLKTDGTGTENEDYSLGGSSEVTIPAGELSKTIDIQIIEDTIPEGGETVIFELGSVQNGIPSIDDLPTRHTLTIAGDIALNDTGVTGFSDGVNYALSSEPANNPAQDGSIGRDATVSNGTDGQAGFSFTKLDANGNPLPTSGSESWRCVRDNVTGLVWERKDPPEDPLTTASYRASNYSYTWYQDDDSLNGGNNGAINENSVPDRRNPIGTSCAYRIDESRRNRLYCNTDTYVVEVNRYGLCGFDDWRVPSASELRSIYRYSAGSGITAPDSTFFPNTQTQPGWAYISSTPSADNDASAWCMDSGTGDLQLCKKGFTNNIRLVRSAEGASE